MASIEPVRWGILSTANINRLVIPGLQTSPVTELLAVASRDELEGAVATELVHNLLRRSSEEPLPILSSLVDAVSDRDRALLDDLERLIREKRRAADREKDR